MSQLVFPLPPEVPTPESAFNYGCFLFNTDNSPTTKFLAVNYFDFAADGGDCDV
jgi:hypothetical protein